MKKELSSVTPPVFEQIKRQDENCVEYWSARDLSKVLEYLEYRNFQPAIERAKEACQNSGQQLENHFVEMHEMVAIGSSAKREMASVKLSRYACSPTFFTCFSPCSPSSLVSKKKPPTPKT